MQKDAIMNLGFIGTGEITVAMVTGFCTAESPPQRIIVSPRNAEKAATLAAAFPIVEVATDNQAVVEASDWLVLALLPTVAEEVLASLRFKPGQKMVSVIAGLPLARIAELAAPAEALSQVLPLPPAARHLGPVGICPPNDAVAELFSRIGTPVEVAGGAEFDAFWTITSLMAPYYGLLQHSATWLVENGVPSEAAGRYVGAMFHALAENARQAGTQGFAQLAESSQTPGGLNEQTYRALRDAGVYRHMDQALDAVLARLQSG
jgi:pyrroline-5-carboxylate reductase